MFLTRVHSSPCFALAGVWARARLGVICLLAFASLAVARATDAEYAVKAAWLFNFAKYCEWPAAAFSREDTPIVVGVLGADPFGPALEQAVGGKTINNRKVTFLRSNRLEDLQPAHILFVTRAEKPRLRELLTELARRPVLTVSDLPGFTEAGGGIYLFAEEDSVRFFINNEAAEKAGLRLRAQLIRLSRRPKG